MASAWPDLDPSIEVHESAGDVGALWDRFEVFEAIHHRQRICNPMNEPEMAELLRLLEPGDADSWLDIACGSGETLIRAAEDGARNMVGVDLSPWMLNAAVRESGRRLVADRPTWVLAQATAWPAPQQYDRVTCLGADWIWHGASGTIRELKARVRVGGRVAYGGPRLHFDADPDRVSADFGRLETADDVEAAMAAAGLRVVSRIDPGDAGWLAYLERGRADVEEWARHHPGERAQRWVAEQQDWWEHFARDREVVGWSVWVAESISP